MEVSPKASSSSKGKFKATSICKPAKSFSFTSSLSKQVQKINSKKKPAPDHSHRKIIKAVSVTIKVAAPQTANGPVNFNVANNQSCTEKTEANTSSGRKPRKMMNPSQALLFYHDDVASNNEPATAFTGIAASYGEATPSYLRSAIWATPRASIPTEAMERDEESALEMLNTSAVACDDCYDKQLPEKVIIPLCAGINTLRL